MSHAHDYFVYMMTNESRVVLYIGVTNDLARRAGEHLEGAVKGFTKRYRVNRLVYYEHYREVRDAIAREKQLKNWSRKKKNLLVETLNPKWNDLGAEPGLGSFVTANAANTDRGLGDPSTSLGMTN